MPTCALCLNDRTLRRSHIYPRFTFRRMREESGEFRRYSSARPGSEGIRRQDDAAEYLLCGECEGRIGAWESDFATRIREGVFDDLTPETENHWVRRQFEYAPTRLYLLSLLWRAHAARQQGFHDVNLGPMHAERLRTMLITGDPGEPWEYGCILAVPQYPVESGRAAASIMPETLPFEGEVGLRIVRMYLDGVLLHFLVGSPECMAGYSGAAVLLERDGGCVVGVADFMEVAYTRDAWAEIQGLSRPT